MRSKAGSARKGRKASKSDCSNCGYLRRGDPYDGKGLDVEAASQEVSRASWA